MKTLISTVVKACISLIVITVFNIAGVFAQYNGGASDGFDKDMSASTDFDNVPPVSEMLSAPLNVWSIVIVCGLIGLYIYYRNRTVKTC